MKAFVFEKEKPSHDSKKNEYKDGFHIVYPYLPMSIGMRYLVRDEVLKLVDEEDGFGNINYQNSLDDVIDKCIIESNGWMMYGSRKYTGSYYKLTHVYKYNFEEEDISEYKKKDLPWILSNRKFINGEEIKYKTSLNRSGLEKQINQVLSENSANYKRKQREENKKKRQEINKDESNDSDDNAQDKPKLKSYSSKTDFDMAKNLTKILLSSRADDYHKWIHVGWALKTVSSNLFDTFIEFSKRSSKYDKTVCQEIWDRARDDGFTIRALHRWAREDNPEEYSKIITGSIKNLLSEAETGTENDIAKVIYELYKHQYICSSIKHNIWYEFQDHRWIEVEAGYTLKNKISDELTGEFAGINAQYYMLAQTATGRDRDDYIKRADNISKIIQKLKKSSFKKSIIEECQNLFYDNNFEELLDSNRDLIGFDNGVYDLKNGCFRDGVPEDYVTISVGYDWEDYNEEHPYIAEIEAFFSKMMREKNMREYILTLLASYLDGYTKQQKVIIWTGTGSNGKSISVSFFQMAFGEYCGVLPITVLTKKQGGSGAATPEMAETRGKRFVVFQEPESDDKIYVGRMKELSGGDWIYARPLFRDPIKFKPQFKLLLTCNKLPTIPSTDGGTWRRLRVSPWESEFVDLDEDGLFYGQELKDNQFPKDYDLEEKMERWKKVFLWYLITKYYPKYIKEGISEPKKVLAFTDKYKRDSDIYYEFLNENLVVTNDKKDYESINVIYNAFKFWYKESYANNKCPSKKELQDYIENHDYDCRKGHVFKVRFVNEDDIAEELDG